MPSSLSDSQTNLLTLAWDNVAWTVNLSINFWVAGATMLAIVGVILWRINAGGLSFRSFEIDQAEIGVGQSKFRFKPNTTDRQVAYSIWVELSTRKIGLPIDLEHDIIAEVYDSWYTFFSVTRELVKGVPVAQVKRDSTQKIIQLSIEVLNEGLRPHLTRWQARYRAWYERELKRYENASDKDVLDPQQIQANFPQFAALKDDMVRVNESLMRYRAKMRQLVMND